MHNSIFTQERWLLLFLSIIVVVALSYPVLLNCCSFAYLLLATCFIISLLLFSLFPFLATHIFILVLLIVNTREILRGYLQFAGLRESLYSFYMPTGHFSNPGPFGGFISVCICLLSAFYYIDNNCVVTHSPNMVLNKKKRCNTEYLYRDKNVLLRIISRLFAWSSLVVLVADLILLFATQSRAAILALCCGLVLLLMGKHSNKRIKTLVKKYFLYITLVFLVAGVGLYKAKQKSADGRLFMDKICIKAIYENGWKGAGFGHFGRVYGETQMRYFKKQIDEKGIDDLDWKAINEHDRITADCPDNAFNEYLFIGVEAGPIAMSLFIVIIITAIVISFKRGTIWCYGLMAFAVFALFSYPLHVKQFQIMLPILLAACVSDRPKNIKEQNDESKAIFAKGKKNILEIVPMLVMLLVLSAFFVLNLSEFRLYKHAEKSWKKAERWYQMKYYEYVVEDCDTLLPYMKQDYRFLFAYGQSLNKTGQYEKSDSILKIGTELSSDPMFWNVMGNNSLALGKYREAEERYKHAFYMVPNRLYPLYLLSKLYDNEGDTTSFLRICGKIETFIPKVESSNTAQLRKEIKEIRKGYLIDHNHMHREKGIKYTGLR